MPSASAGPEGQNYSFASDHTAGVCPEAWAALGEANRGCAPSYGDDPWTARTAASMRRIFETDCETYLVFNGTAANSLALSALCKPYASILCHEISHVQTDECSAPEFFTGGSKVIPVPGSGGKLHPVELAAALSFGRGVHFPKPGALSLTQSTEWGTLYTPAEVAALAAPAHDRGMGVHMDGARFANAAAALREATGASPADITWRAGVDVLSFGGTKNGLMATEAVVFFDLAMAREFDFRVKRAGQLTSKMRYSAAQWAAILESGAWLRNGSHANKMAARLAAALRPLPGARLIREPEASAVFVELPAAAATAMEALGWHFYRFIGENGYRLMCSWATQESDIDAFATDLRSTLSGARTEGS